MSGLIYSNSGPLTSLDVDADVRALDTILANVDVIATPPGSDTGQAALAVRVISSLADGGAITGTVSLTGAPTASVSSVASSATNVTLLAANANRRGATVFNDSTANLYLKLGTTATASSFTVLMYSQTYFEVPFQYTGRIDGIWASANGNARITEIT